jgi:hypothetical protein
LSASAQRWSLRTVGIAGVSLYATFLAFTYSVPEWVERFAGRFIQAEVEARIDRTIDGLELPRGEGLLSQAATALFEENSTRIKQYRTALKNNVHDLLGAALAEVADADCACREKYSRILRDGLEFNVVALQAANDQIVEFVQMTYMDVLAELKRDIRIFTGSNAVVFLVLLLVSFLKPGAAQHLFLPGILLAIAAVICSYFYVFEQNWLLTIIYSDYIGFAYLAYLGVVLLFLCDIAFNRGRVTTEIINAIFNATGSAFSVVPC